MRKRLLWIAPLAIVGMALFVALGGAVVMWLWNWLLPTLFTLPRLGFWQAVGLLALCRILFGGFGMHGSNGSGFRRRMREHWSRLRPEERERFRQRMRERWGIDPSTNETESS